MPSEHISQLLIENIEPTSSFCKVRRENVYSKKWNWCLKWRCLFIGWFELYDSFLFSELHVCSEIRV